MDLICLFLEGNEISLFQILFSFFSATYGHQPSLEIQPNQKVVTKEVGGSLALTCRPNVQDPGLVTQLEWRDPRNRRIDSSNRANSVYVQMLAGEPGAVLIFSSLTENQAGKYTCHAFYANTESLSASVELNTYIDISFIDAPENQYPIVGKDFEVKCKVKGNPAPLIDWNKNEQSIKTNEKFVVGPDRLLIRNVTEADDGVYKCTAIELSTGQFKTRNIKVEVQVPPKIQPIDSITIIEGESASAKCTATGKPPPTYQWIKLKDRQDLSITDRFDVKENTGELIMNRVEFSDDGVYKCIAENTVAREETTVMINVLVRPKIYSLINVTAPVGAQAELVCKSYGRPPPKVSFRKLSEREPFKVGQQLDDRRITMEQQFFEEKGEAIGTLIISNLSRSDDGLYECMADNKAGTGYKNGHITIEFPPTFERTKDLPPVWSWDNKPGNLTCLPEAIPNATIIWRYGGIEIQNNQNFQKIGNGPASFLIVTPHNEKRLFTQYECIASNKLGQSSIKIQLKQAFVPAQVAQARPESVTATTIKFSIIPANNFDGLPLRSYTIKYKPERELSWEFANNHTWSYNAPYILENLVPEETYHFQIAAKNDVGMGAFSNLESVTMPRRSEPAEPKILVESHNRKDENNSNREDKIALSPYADHFELRWGVPNDNGDPIQHYLVRYCVTEKISGEWRDRDCSEQIQQSVQYTSYQLEHLHPDTIYKIELRAHNAIGDSSPAQVKVRTARGIDPIVPVQTPTMSSAAIIGIVIAAILLVLIVLDITCYSVNRLGVIAMCCNSKSKKADEEDPKLGRPSFMNSCIEVNDFSGNFLSNSSTDLLEVEGLFMDFLSLVI
ncbi:neural cell adhesion molecule fasciclin 2 isoform X3 [Leptinotarsa decemlineata]|uniref:neural cell adhesion molecule fasciclin 2 isoform X3 n=1 Tax=Leptinotarsa decemlineata TaxID=7539 RepID=UPI003D307AC6